MNHNNGHIISTLKWDTLLCDREKSHELQTRLSGWSRFNLQNEVNSVFDKFCDPKKVWRINSLEIDLGQIEFNELDHDLGIKFRNRIAEKLQAMLMKHPASHFYKDEIIDQSSSVFQALGHFFKFGVYPWNMQHEVVSVNQIFQEQIKRNPKAVMKMLQEIVHSDKTLLKRIAWQIDDPGIISVIRLIEPTSSKQIIEFSENLVKIQHQESNLNSGSHEFQKNLWHWILNYLFTNHGSSFNKKEFLKSSLRQMSAHFNIEYTELIEVIDKALHKTNLHHQYNSEILDLLDTITIENNKSKTQDVTFRTDTLSKGRDELISLFVQKPYILSNKEKNDFSRLINRFSSKDKTWFKNFIVQHNHQNTEWINNISQLSDHTFIAVLEALHSVNPYSIVQLISSLNDLCQKSGISIDLTTLRKLVLQYLNNHKGGELIQNDLVLHLIVLIKTQSNISEKSLLNLLTTKQQTFTSKNITSVELYEALADLNVSSILKHVADKPKDIVIEIIQLLTRLDVNTLQGVKLIKMLAQIMQKHPALSLQLFVEYPDKYKLHIILNQVLNNNISYVLIKSSKGEKYYLLHEIEKELKKSALASNNSTSIVSEHLYNTALMDIILNPIHDNAQFFESVIRGLFIQTPNSEISRFRLLVSSLLTEKSTNFKGISFDFKKNIIGLYGNSNSKEFIQRLCELLSSNQDSRIEICKQLSTKYSKNKLAEFANTKQVEAELISNHILPGSASIKKKMINEYCVNLTKLMSISQNVISNRLREIFWQCLLNYNSYSGNTHRFRAQFHAAVLFNFPLASGEITKDRTDKKIRSQINVKVQSNTMISFSEAEIFSGNNKSDQVFSTAENVWTKKLLKPLYKDWNRELFISLIREKAIPAWFTSTNSQYSVQKLLNDMIRYFPFDCIQILKEEDSSDSIQQWLYTNLDFQNLIKASSESNKTRYTLLNQVLQMHTLLNNNSWKGTYAGLLDKVLFRVILKAIISNKLSGVSPLRYWQQVSQEMILKMGISKNILLEEVNKNFSLLPASWQKAFKQFSHTEIQSKKVEDINDTKEKVLSFLNPVKHPRYLSPAKEGITIFNAGLVLLNSYFTLLFDRLGVTANNSFVNDNTQMNAVHILQYLATGLDRTDEHLLPLNKVLCGMDITQPVTDGILITENIKEASEGLINTVISFWTQIGKTSVSGFRGNWLVRTGILKELEDRWDLVVEKRAYDILLNQIPFSFSVIRLPWMTKPLHVTWQY